ncbi:MAG TPA: hypothetical protein VKI20_02320 [Acidimicrobiales bacterium]|nr:hypothetical protein [Acidimicrobiales bacterium]
MARRIEVELTSKREDGTWTWRAAGAKQPKGVLDGSLLYSGAKVGDVVKAEADFEVDGIFVTSVFAPKADARRESARLELIGPTPSPEGVTTSLVGRDRKRREPGRGGDERDRGDRPRPARSREKPERGEGAERAAGAERPRRERAGRPEREERRKDHEERRRPASRGPGRPEGRPPGTAAPERQPSAALAAGEQGAREEERPKPKRLSPAHVHRTAALESLPPEQRPIAEQVLRGGIPAVRQAVEAQNKAAREEGTPEIPAGQIMALAEELLPRLKTAEWRDRAEAAVQAADEISVRDLRSVVAGADAAARDDETRLLASTLREALENRLRQQRDEWLAEIAGALDEGRLVRALRQSARPPDPSVRFPAELAARLSAAAGEAMAPDTPPDRWIAVLDAVGASPVRRLVKPAGLPGDPGDDLLKAAKQACGRVPALAALLGIDMPPPPGPPRPAPGRGPGPRPGQPRPWSARGRSFTPGRPPPAPRPAAVPEPAQETAPEPAQPTAPEASEAAPEPSNESPDESPVESPTEPPADGA